MRLRPIQLLTAIAGVIVLLLLSLYAIMIRQPSPRVSIASVSSGVRSLTLSFSIEAPQKANVTVEVVPVGCGDEEPKRLEMQGVEPREGVISSELRFDVKGGCGYRVRVEASIGHRKSSAEEFEPYVRAFDDLAAELAEKGLVISASYMPWNMAEVLGSSWQRDKPLLGFYDAADDFVQWKHIDWARGHGIYLFWVDWTNYASTPVVDRLVKVTQGLLDKGMAVGIMIGPQVGMASEEGYPSINLGYEQNSAILLSVIQKAVPLLNHPNYYRVEGRPAILIWNEAAFYNRAEAYRRLKELVKSACGAEPYLIADALPRISRRGPLNPLSTEGGWYLRNILGRSDGGDRYIDAYTSWVGFLSVQGPEALTPETLAQYSVWYREHLEQWASLLRASGKRIVPTVSPGFDRTHDPTFNQSFPIARDRARLIETLMVAVQTVGGRGEVRVDTWNDFFEGTYVEPSEAEGFEMLSALKQALSELLASKR